MSFIHIASYVAIIMYVVVAATFYIRRYIQYILYIIYVCVYV